MNKKRKKLMIVFFSQVYMYILLLYISIYIYLLTYSTKNFPLCSKEKNRVSEKFFTYSYLLTYSKKEELIMKMLDTRRKFLEYFPQNKKSSVNNEMLSEIRKAEYEDPISIIKGVIRKNKNKKIGSNLDLLVKAFLKHKKEAVRYIKYLFEWEELSKEEKNKIKEKRGEVYIKEYMENKTVSNKQIQCIKKLGYKGKLPADMACASELIKKLQMK